MKNKHGIKEMVTRYLKEGSTEDNARARVADENQPKNRERALRNMMQVILRSQPRPPYTGPKRRATDTGKVVEELDPEQYKRLPRESKRDYLDRIAQLTKDTTKATDINSGDEGADPEETITQRNERRAREKAAKENKPPQKDWTEYAGPSLSEQADYIARFLESVSWEEQHAEALKKAQGQPTFSPKGEPPIVPKKYYGTKFKKPQKKKAKKKLKKDWTEYEGTSLYEQADYIDWFLNEARLKRSLRVRKAMWKKHPPGRDSAGHPDPGPEIEAAKKKVIQAQKSSDERSGRALGPRNIPVSDTDDYEGTQRARGLKGEKGTEGPDRVSRKAGRARRRKRQDSSTEYAGPSLSEQADYIDWFLEGQAGGYESERTRRGDASRPETPAGQRHQRRMEDRNKPENVAARKKIADILAAAKAAKPAAKKKKKKKPVHFKRTPHVVDPKYKGVARVPVRDPKTGKKVMEKRPGLPGEFSKMEPYKIPKKGNR